MFGYLRIQKGELLVREYEAYKSVYCGLCRQLGRDYSFLTRLSLSYDCTFYAMLLLSLKRSCKGFKDGRCVCNPVKKCSFAVSDDDGYSKTAAFSVISVYYKLLDDMRDGGFPKKAAAAVIKPFFSHWRKKAAKLYPEIDALAREMTEKQCAAEKNPNCGIDEAAHPTAEMLGLTLALEAENDTERRVYYEFAYNIGRWIYLIDAADDYERDKKSGNFNPFVNCGCDTSAVKAALSQALARAYDAFALMNIVDFKGILENMLLYGLPAEQNRIIEKIGGINEQSL